MDLNALLSVFITQVVPVIAALGLFHMGAASGRALWAKIQGDAAKTQTKIDDFFVHLADPFVMAGLKMLDAGDVEGAKKKIAEGIAAINKNKK